MAKKINFYDECYRIVQNNVYLDMTRWVEFVAKQPGFWDGDADLPLTWNDIEYKVEDDEEYDTDWSCAYAVSAWLADELYEHGEMVARVPGYPYIWLRRTLGQSLVVDGVIEEIVREWLVSIGSTSKTESNNSTCETDGDIEEDEKEAIDE